MVYKQLIEQLKKVKTEKQISKGLAIMLTQVAIDAHMTSYLKDHKDIDPEEALDMTRMSMLKEADFVLLDIHEQFNNFTGDPDQIPSLENMPFGDDTLKKQLDKAFKDYNKRMDIN